MCTKIRVLTELLTAHRALVGLLSGVRTEVKFHLICPAKLVAADRTLKPFLTLTSVGQEVALETASTSELLVAYGTLEGLRAIVNTKVNFKVTALRKRLLTHRALEGFLASVSTQVCSECWCTTKLHVTKRTLKRLLSGVGTEVLLKVTAAKEFLTMHTVHS